MVVRRRMRGAGFWDSLKDLYKKGKNAAIDSLAKIHKNIKDTKSVSRALGYSKHAGKSSTLGDLANSLGYGRKKRVVRRRRMRGGAWYDDVWSGVKYATGAVNDFAKATGIAGKLLPGPAGAVARALGYGRKKRVVRRKRGAGFFDSFNPAGVIGDYAKKIRNEAIAKSGGARRKRGGATMTVMPRRIKSTQMLQSGGRLNKFGYGKPRQMGGRLNQFI